MGKALIFDGIVVTEPLETITITSISEEAETISSNFDDIDNTKTSALNVLINNLKTAGTWNKLRLLMLPILASDVDGAAKNVLMTTGGVPSTTNLSFSNHKLLVGNSITIGSEGLINQLLDSQQGIDFATNTEFSTGFYVEPADSNKTLITFGSLRLYNNVEGTNSAFQVYTDTQTSSTPPSYFRTVGGTPLSKFSSVAAYNEDNNIYPYYITDSNSTANTPSARSSLNSISLANTNEGLNLNATTEIHLLWAGIKMTKEELESTHIAFKTFVDTLESMSE